MAGSVGKDGNIAQKTMPYQDVKDRFARDGFVSIRGILPTDIVEEWEDFGIEFFRKTFEHLHEYGHTAYPEHCRMRNGEKEFALGLGVKSGFREIVMRSPGRYEISILNSVKAGQGMPSLVRIKDLLAETVPILLEERSWESLSVCNLSFVVSTPGSKEQAWHADGGHVSLREHLPCHVFNIFVPLRNVSLQMGPTEFRPGSHIYTRNLAPMMLAAKARKKLRAPAAPLLNRGDILVFDYRVLHRGLANRSGCNRSFLVLTVSKPWFKDILNFPARSMHSTVS
jgi:hypothetical protein